MISARLVHLIEANADQIVDRVAAQVRREPLITHGKEILDYELHGLGRDLLGNLGQWLSSGNFSELLRRFERLGTICYEQSIPLHEALHGLSLLREKILDVAQENMISNSSIELYGEEELDRRVGRFFDRLGIHTARGFEDAVRHMPVSRQTVH
jgi:hypothetical protein